MHIECPHCQNPIEIVESAALKEIVCPSCGSSFSTSDLPTKTYQAPAPPFPKIGRFELKELLGQGAFGSVWRAHDTELDRDVAVKVPRPGVMGGQEFEDRFLRELRAMAGLRHEGIVTVHEGGRQDGSLYIVSDLIRGVNLAEWLSGQPGGRLGMREAATLVAQIADAVEHAHTQGVIHRDLKPSNILLDESGRPHISDFGLAKREAVEVPITREGRHLGTPAYMSPEQAAGQSHRADARSDVWSLGVILYELLTGERPFRGVERMILHQILQDEPRPLRRVNDKLSRDLETITLKCLAKSPARRYGTARALSDDLGRWLRGEPILARPVGAVEKLWLWSRRNPRVAGLAGAVALLLVLVAAVSSIMAFRESRHRQFAEQAARTERDLRTAADQANTQLAQANTDLEAAKNEAVQQTQMAMESLDRLVDEVQSQVFTKQARKRHGENAQRVADIVVLSENAAMEARAKKGKPLSPRTQMGTFNNLASLYRDQGRFDMATETYDRVIKLAEASRGNRERDTLNEVEIDLASALRGKGEIIVARRGSLDLALSYLQESRQLLEPLAARNPNDSLVQTNLAATFFTLGSLEEQELKFAEAHGFFDNALKILNNLEAAGKFIDDRQRFRAVRLRGQLEDEILECLLLEEVIKHPDAAKLPPVDSKTLTTIQSAAEMYFEREQPEKARPLFELCIRAQRAQATPDDPDFADLLDEASLYLLQHRQYPTAETYLRECLTIREKQLPDDWVLFNTKSLLGGALAGQTRFLEAEPLLVEGYSGMKARAAQIPPAAQPRLPEAIRRLVDLYTAWDKPEEAEKWRKELDARKEAENSTKP